MRTLVISDYFYKLKSLSKDEFEWVKWSEFRTLSLGGYDSIIVDMTFKNKKPHPKRTKLLSELKKEFEKSDFLSKNNLILLVICGSREQSLKYDIPSLSQLSDDYEYYNKEPDEVYYKDQRFSNYDFLKALIPESKEKIEFRENRHIYPMATIPVFLYLDEYKKIPTFLSYDYNPDSEKFRDLTPLAKLKEKSNTCVGFECKVGKGLVIVLPPYNVKDKEKAFSLLSRISRSYFKKREGAEEFIKANELIPNNKELRSSRESFIEAWLCFHYDLYAATVLMCRRSLEASIPKKETNKIKFLGQRIKDLYEKGIIDSNLKDIANEVVEFGNWGAHPEKYPDKEITEEDAMNAIEFLKNYFEYFYHLPRRFRESEERRQELKKKEVD
ncbi:MAG: DUF4145 domain-containing protein [bacterium]